MPRWELPSAEVQAERSAAALSQTRVEAGQEIEALHMLSVVPGLTDTQVAFESLRCTLDHTDGIWTENARIADELVRRKADELKASGLHVLFDTVASQKVFEDITNHAAELALIADTHTIASNQERILMWRKLLRIAPDTAGS